MIEDRRGVDTSTPRADALDDRDLVELYATMVRIREFEDQVHRSFLAGLVHGTTHLCQGHEAVSAGAARALRDDDYVTYTYRGHGHCIARGLSPEAAFAELFGRATGASKGLGGSMHMTDVARGLIGSFGIVGAGLPVAVGAGQSAQLSGRGQVSMTFFGDGATNIGAFHESLNLAAVWALPVIFVCENNLYGEYTRIEHTTPFEDLARRAAAYDMPGIIVDGNDVLAVYDTVAGAVDRARDGGGPSFIECKTYRQRGHSRTDPAKYRSAEEVEAWLARDPLKLFRGVLLARGALSDRGADALVEEIRGEIAAAAEAARNARWPDAETALNATYA
ncbi:MAG TPA: thiamine pyrophosphate-dependent dehydrogenase E1 component subunit alpha [Kiloniellales bacterium]